MLALDTSALKGKKNLLAFSFGVDSSALFFLLLKHDIIFDIALVNYGIRQNADEEERQAKILAKKYNLVCHSIKAPKYKSNFEKHARDFRYTFFENLIEEYHYDTLLTAHQLNDQLEWLLMRLSKGAGTSELLGLETVSQRENYSLLRPLLTYSKDELLNYLQEHKHPYFVDESNSDERYERNRFRKQFSDPLIAHYKEGIQRSFVYLAEDKKVLESEFELIYSHEKLRVIKLHTPKIKSRASDIILKSLGYLLSASQRQEIAKEQSLVIGGKWAIQQQDSLLYIAPYLISKMPKKFKESCRTNQIPSKIRPYLYQEKIDPKSLAFSI